MRTNPSRIAITQTIPPPHSPYPSTSPITIHDISCLPLPPLTRATNLAHALADTNAANGAQTRNVAWIGDGTLHVAVGLGEDVRVGLRLHS
jgi:hypothetical protein